MYLGKGRGINYILGDLTGQGGGIMGDLTEVLKTYVVDAHICTGLISSQVVWVSRRYLHLSFLWHTFYANIYICC